MRKILFVLDSDNKFRGNLPTSKSLDVKKIIKLFEKSGYSVEKTSYNKIVNNKKYENYFVIYTSSQLSDYKLYIDDILFDLNNNNILVPRYSIFKAHENKSYQEILKKQIGIKSNNGKIYASRKDLLEDGKTFNYPIILKTISGAGSKGVHKINSIDEIDPTYDKISFHHKSLFFNFKRKLKQKFNIKYDKYWYDNQRQHSYVAIQNFIPNLDSDWKILVFNNKIFFLNRGIKENDFRASGSGLLNFDKHPSDNILNFAKSIFEKLDVPFISLDIAEDEKNKCHLIEFQGLHFGPLTLTKSKGFYSKEKESWKYTKTSSNLEEEYVNSYIKFIERKYKDEK